LFTKSPEAPFITAPILWPHCTLWFLFARQCFSNVVMLRQLGTKTNARKDIQKKTVRLLLKNLP